MSREIKRLTEDLLWTLQNYQSDDLKCYCEIEEESPLHVLILNDLPNIVIYCLGCGYFFDPTAKCWYKAEQKVQRFINSFDKRFLDLFGEDNDEC